MNSAACRSILLMLAVTIGGCAGGDDDENPVDDVQQHPDVVEVAVARGPSGAFDFDVTVSSPYDSPERYADAWRIIGPDDRVYGVRELLHDHAAEQPFTRSLAGVEIPAGVDIVVVEARDLINGWGGATVEVELPASS